jgi:hypothetical protein
MWAHREDFVLEQTWAIYAGRDPDRTPAPHVRMLKESSQCFGAGGYRYSAPSALPVAGQKGIHIFQGDIGESTIPLC